MSDNGDNPTGPRPRAELNAVWNPNTGEFNYRSSHVNGMEALGMLVTALLLRFQQLQPAAGAHRVERTTVLPAEMLRRSG